MKTYYTYWKRELFDKLPLLPCESLSNIDALVILPAEEVRLHDSGYRLMCVAVIQNDEPIGRTQLCSDIFHLGGIGGYNRKDWVNNHTPIQAAWSIDCLPMSGLMRIFNAGGTIELSIPLSSLEIYGTI